MSKNYTFGTAIVTAAVAANLQEMSRRLDKDDCGGMFTAGLSSTGLAPATHFISSGWIPQVYANTLTSNTLLFTRAKAAWEADGDVFPYTQLQVTNALNACDFSNGTRAPVGQEVGRQPESPFEAMTRLGLKPIAGVP